MTEDQIEDEHEHFVECVKQELLSMHESWHEIEAEQEAEQQWLAHAQSLREGTIPQLKLYKP